MNQRPKQLLILFSDTGGGHRSSAHAVSYALKDLYGEKVQIELVDALVDYAPWPLNRLGNIYPQMVCLRGWFWAASYHLSNGPRQAELFMRTFWPWVNSAVFRLLQEHPADAILSCHPVFNHLILRALDKTGLGSPLITLVTDLATAHAFWIAPEITCCLVPTQEGRRCALACGVPDERIVVTGLPVGPNFVATAHKDPSTIRQQLGLALDLPLVLLSSGAEGMGSVYHLCKQITSSGIRYQLVVIAGRNRQLQSRLSAEAWPIPVRVEGFVSNMHEWMRAADLLVTKAGPSTVSEALVMGLPMVLSGALPGQERPNADYIVRAGAGIWAPTPRQVTRAVSELVSPENSTLAQMAERAQALARPDAAWHVARAVWAAAGGEPA